MRILIAGDFCPTQRIQDAFDNGDYSAFKDIKPIIDSCDYSVVNLECPIVTNTIAQPIIKNGLCLKTNKNAISALQFVGFDCVTLANNHFRDYGDDGCTTTLESLNNAEIDYVGGGRDLHEAQQVLYKDISGTKLAIVNFCENEFSIATETHAGAAPLDTVDNFEQITTARLNAEYVLVIVHGGHEYYQLPSPRMKKLYRHFIRLGADAVVNHHQHCYSGYECIDGKPIIYGLGNFCFDETTIRNSSWNEGFIVEIDTATSHIKLIPYKQCNEHANIRLLSENETNTFNDRIAELNTIINNDELLNLEFDKWVNRCKKIKLTTLAPYCHRYLNAAARRGWIPIKLKAKQACIMLNHIACESHRDITIKVITDRILDNK